jgi:hypothetical protein
MVDSYVSLKEWWLIKLFLYGAFEVLQHRDHILAMRIRVAQGPLIYKHMVELLAGLKLAPRMKYLQVYSLGVDDYPGPRHYPTPLQSLAPLTFIHGFGSLVPWAQLNSQELLARVLTNLAHLEILEIPPVWLQDLGNHFTDSTVARLGAVQY